MDNHEYDFETVCRSCLNENMKMKSLFEVEISNENKIHITDFIRRITALKITKGDGLPENICIVCIEKICNAYSFAQLCIAADDALRLQRKQKALRNIQQEIMEEEGVHENLESIDTSVSLIESDITDSLNDQFSNAENDNSDSVLENIDIIKEVIIKDQRKTRKSEPQSHRETRKTNRNKFQCTSCTEAFNTKEKLMHHEKSHDSTKPYKCDECCKTFTKQTYLVIHQRKHVKQEDKQYICKVCGEKFVYLYLLKQHSFKHTEEKPFPCSKCNKGCLTAESLRRHMKIHDQNYVRKKHACEICFKEFRYPSFLSEHMKNHTGERPFLCSICGKGFRQNGTLEYHMRSHTGYKPYACQICNNSFTSQGVLRVHMRRHTNERPYVCDMCGMAFRQSTDMKSHKRTHTGDKPVLCTVCGKRMSTTGQLTIHLRSHTGEKPFSCKTCTKAFATRATLVKHERIHTGERPYVCNVCGRAFNQSSTLKTHSNIHKLQQPKETKDVIIQKVIVLNTNLVSVCNSVDIHEQIIQDDDLKE